MNSPDAHAKYDKSRLFSIGVIALFTAALSVALRAAVAGDIKAAYLDPIDIAQSGAMIAQVLALSFLGFSLVLFVLSPFLDIIGMRRMLLGASVAFIVGNLLVIGAGIIANGEAVYWLIGFGMLLNGFAWGAVEATINPMTTALYKEEKIHRLNVLHAWWPAGMIVGGLVGVAFAAMNLNWQIAMLLIVVSALVFGFLCLGVEFPPTERLERGVGTLDMFKEIFRRPSFFIWFAAMFLTAASELAPGQWVDLALTHTVGMRGILLLVYVSGLMFVMRHFAGPLAHRLSDSGLLWVSSLLAAVGLYLLSLADSAISGLLAATVWGMGVAFMWPTMLAAVAKRYPDGGSWMIGLMGSAGALSIYLVLPQLGKIYDAAKLTAAGSREALLALSGDQLATVETFAATRSFQTVALIPLFLLIIFAAIWWFERKRSFKSEKAVVLESKV